MSAFREGVQIKSTIARKTTNDIICTASVLLDDSERRTISFINNLKGRLGNLQTGTKNYAFSFAHQISDEFCFSDQTLSLLILTIILFQNIEYMTLDTKECFRSKKI